MKNAKAKGRAKSKTSAKGTGKKRSGKQKSSGKNKNSEVNLAEVRKDITQLVSDEALNMAQAVIDWGLTGQLAPVKYLFEATGLYPPSEAAAGKPEEDGLAKLLLDTLHLPVTPVITDEDDVTPPVPAGECEGVEKTESEAEVGAMAGAVPVE